MRNLLLSYDYSKSTDPLQPLAAHVTSLLGRSEPDTSDITITSADQSFKLHKFILAARCPYFRKKLAAAPETTTFKLPATIPPQAFSIALRHVYLAELPRDVGGGPGTGYSEREVLDGIDKLSSQLELGNLMEDIIGVHNRRQARQNRTSETGLGRAQLETWFRENVLRYKVTIDSDKANEVKWVRNNAIFADILLRADEEVNEELEVEGVSENTTLPKMNGIPVGPMADSTASGVNMQQQPKSVLFPVHRAMLLRSDYFSGMFSSGLVESQEKPHLHIVKVDCTPEVLEWILLFLYAEKTDFPLDIALEILFAADILFIERLKSKAALVISTLGSGTLQQERGKLNSETLATSATPTKDVLDPFETLRAAWELRVPRLENFVARYFAYRLEQYVDLPEFADLIKESAARIRNREETDTIEIIDDIRHYLSERFRLRFEGEGIAELLDEGVHESGLVGDINGSQQPFGNSAIENGLGHQPLLEGEIRTLDGELVSDEFESDALDYRMLLGKIEILLEKLELDA